MWPNPQFAADLVTFTEEILNENFSFCAAWSCQFWSFQTFSDSNKIFSSLHCANSNPKKPWKLLILWKKITEKVVEQFFLILDQLCENSRSFLFAYCFIYLISISSDHTFRPFLVLTRLGNTLAILSPHMNSYILFTNSKWWMFNLVFQSGNLKKNNWKLKHA